MPRKGYADVLEKDPTKNMSEEEKIGRTKTKLSESDRSSLQNQINEAEIELQSRKALSGTPDLSDVQAQIKQKKMILQHDDDLTPKSGTERDRLAKRAAELASELKRTMPTHNEMWPKHGSIEAQRALRHNIEFQAKYSDQCREWQDIQKKLNPDDPYASSLETIRPD